MSIRGIGLLGLACLTLAAFVNSAQAQRCETDETATLAPFDGEPADRYGRAVAVSGDVIVVGAHQDDDNGPQSGSVYVYRFNGTSWSEEAKLTASDGAIEDHFGRSVAISGDIIVVGSYLDDDACQDDPDCDSGAAYIFRYNGDVWVQEQKLTAADAEAHDFFGWSISISGEVIVVGAYLHDDFSLSNNGSAYIYRDSGDGWVEDDKLVAPDFDTDDFFGFSVAVSGDRVVIGSEADDDVGFGSGSAYIYQYNGLDWDMEEKLTASDGSFGALFGFSVAIDNATETIVVGAICDSEFAECSGKTYVFMYSDNGTPKDPEDDFWAEHSRLIAPSNIGAFDQFGFSVSVSGDAILVGKHLEDFFGLEHQGSAILYRYHDNLTPEDPADDFWFDQAEFGAEMERRAQFGFSVSLDGPTAVTGAHQHDELETDPGTAAVFRAIWLDSDEDGVLDSCDNCVEFFNPDQADCNGDGIGDVCEIELFGAPDCNQNLVPDECDIDSGFSLDCDGNEIPDECVGRFFFEESEELSPFGAGFPQSFELIAPPRAAPGPTSGHLVFIDFFYRGDLGAPTEWFDVEINGVEIDLLVDFSRDCPDKPDFDFAFFTSQDFNALLDIGGGDLIINMLPNEAVDPFACDPSSFIQVNIQYQAVTDLDCNANFIPDICDVLSGFSRDLNENLKPDECEPDTWFEDFEAYESGSDLQDQGGWKGWEDDPDLALEVAAGRSAAVRSPVNSVRVEFNRNGVREFEDYTSGRLTFMTYQFIPEDHIEATQIALMSRYHEDFATIDFEEIGAGDAWTEFTIPLSLPGASWVVSNGVYRLRTPETVSAGDGVGAGLALTGADSFFSDGFWSATVVRQPNSGSDLIMRAVGDLLDSNHYRFGWSQQGGGTLFIDRVDDGVRTRLGSAGGFFQLIGRPFVIEAGASGPDLELRMWEEGDSRPDAPQVTATDGTYEAGFNGIFARAQSEGSITVTYDDVSFTPSQSARNFSTRLLVSGQSGRVESIGPSGGVDALLRDAVVVDQWIQIRVEIDLDADTQSIYYDNQLVITKSWTEGLDGGGSRSLGALNLAGGGSSEVFYDDMSVTPEEPGEECDPCDMNCDGDINAFDIEPFLDLLFGGGEPCNSCTGDANGDGDIDAFDIEPFLSCLFP